MNTQTAATRAHVTPRTIQAWCRSGAVTAAKTHGRWDIDETTLNRRIALARRPATCEVRTDNAGRYIALGPAAALEAAYRAEQPVRITAGPCAGDTVLLGLHALTYGDYGITPETTGLIRAFTDGTAAYAIDTRSLNDAPRLTAIQDAAEAEADRREIEAAAADHAYLYPAYE